MSINDKYKVIIDPFAEKHYLKKMQKKYKKSFNIPWDSFVNSMLPKFDILKETDRVSLISNSELDQIIYKIEFKILPKESTKSSGNRCIVLHNKIKKEVQILFVYHKSDIKKNGKETMWWKEVVKENFSELGDIL